MTGAPDLPAPTLAEVAAFLLGEAPLDGLWYGEPDPKRRGEFWWRTPLRAALAAQSAPQQSAWVRAVDDAMVVSHLGVADEADDYETAKRKLNALLSHEQSVGAYFAEVSERERWESALSAVMPADFKDWHQNSPAERPEVAAWVITNLRQRLDEAEAIAAAQPADAALLRQALEALEVTTQPVRTASESHRYRATMAAIAALRERLDGER